MKQQYLLIEDVESIGRSGEIISVKPGFARNFLIPQKKALLATHHVLRMQAKLQEERLQQASLDKQEAEGLAAKIEGMVLRIVAKVDPEGNLYGSVGAVEIVRLFEKEEIKIEKRNVGINLHIKTLGSHVLTLKLKEGVVCKYTLEIESDQPIQSK